MVSSLEELGTILEDNNLTPADIEYIVNFMTKEKISPQLAMRRIKAFDSLKEKLEQNEDQEKVELLEQELHEIKNQLMEKNQLIQSMQQEKSGLETEKQELETKSELIDSEREELQRQLEMIRDMQITDETEEKIDTSLLQELKDQMEKLEKENEHTEKIIRPLTKIISEIIEKQEFEFDIQEYRNLITEFASSKSGPDTNISKTKTEESVVATTPKIREENTKKEETIKEQKKVEKEPSKKEEPKKKISAKEEQVLNLFLEFVEEAETDKGFQERVSTICDMDEAYQYLGSIGLSQVYSFASRGMDKKEELQELLKSWKNEGIPR